MSRFKFGFIVRFHIRIKQGYTVIFGEVQKILKTLGGKGALENFVILGVRYENESPWQKVKHFDLQLKGRTNETNQHKNKHETSFWAYSAGDSRCR